MPRPQSETDPYYIETDPQAGQKALSDLGMFAGAVNSVITPMGDYEAWQDAQSAAEKGNYGESLFHTATTFPFVGDALKPLGSIFLGVKSLENAGIPFPEYIRQAIKEGMPSREMWRKYGWKEHPTRPNKYQFEISDHDAKLDVEALKAQPNQNLDELSIAGQEDFTKGYLYALPKLGDFFDHPELYKYHPEAANMRVLISDDGGSEASFRGAFDNSLDKSVLELDRSILNNPDRVMENVLHELGHGMQMVEGWQRGENLARMLPPDVLMNIELGQMKFFNKGFEVAEKIDEVEFLRELLENPTELGGIVTVLDKGDIKEYWENMWDAYTLKPDDPAKSMKAYIEDSEFNAKAIKKFFQDDPDTIEEFSAWASAFATSQERATRLYAQSYGEVEPRLISARWKMTPQERRDVFPDDMADVDTIHGGVDGAIWDEKDLIRLSNPLMKRTIE